MENVVKADIFFFVTSIAVVVFTIGVVIAMYYVVRILKEMKRVSKKISEEGDKIIGDVEYFREAVKNEGTKIKNVANFFLGWFIRRQKREKAKRVNKDNSNER